MFDRPKNRDADQARYQMIGRRRDSQDGGAVRADSMLDSKVKAAKDMRTSSTIRQAGNSRVQVNNKLDLTGYRGNLYK